MAFDYKKEYKEFYMPPKKPSIVDVPRVYDIVIMLVLAYFLFVHRVKR